MDSSSLARDPRGRIDNNHHVDNIGSNNITNNGSNNNIFINNSTVQSEKREIEQWLAPPDPSKNYSAARNKHTKDTGRWLTDGLRYKDWKEIAGTYLWLHGKAGCGKTMLASSVISDVINHCEMGDGRAYAYFFFDGRDSQTALQLHENLIRSLLAQLLSQHHTVPECLVKLHKAGKHPTLTSLQAAFVEVVGEFGEVFVVIDSLDECSDRPKLLDWTIDIHALNNLHLLATSRPEPDIQRKICALASLVAVALDDASVTNDMEKHIEETFGLTNRWTEAQIAEIKVVLLESAGGMFRLLDYQLREIQKCYTIQSIKKKLKSLPRDLNDMYEQILSMLGDDLEAALELLKWLAFSIRPLKLEEIREIGIVNLRNVEQDGLMAFDEDGLLHEDFILGACSGLVAVNEGFVKLVHLSIKEHIFSPHSMSPHKIGEPDAQLAISQTCLVYLAYCGEATGAELDNEVKLDETSALNKHCPLYLYAAIEMSVHVSLAGSDNVPSLFSLLKAFFKPESLPFLIWRLCWRGFYSDYACPKTRLDIDYQDYNANEPLYYAARLGFDKIVEWFLDNGAVKDIEEGLWAYPLQAASGRGHKQIVKALLNREANVNAKGGEYDTALQAAAATGHTAIVELLLEKGADVNVKGGHYGSALQAGAAGGHTAIVELLLKQGANVNVEGGYYGSALQAAADRGHTATVEALLEKGANVNAEGGYYSSVLQAAVERGHTDIVELLLKQGANVNVEGGYYGSALQAAADRGHTATVEALLEKGGANVNAEGGMYGSALQAGAAGGHTAIVELLLKQGANVNVEGGYYGSALQAAADRGHTATVEALLEKGANVNAEGGVYGTPLQSAAVKGYVAIVEALLEKGANVNAEGGVYGTPLQSAAVKGHVAIVEVLLKQGADVNVKGGQYGSALQAAATKGHTAIVELLLKQGANVNVEGADGSPLVSAATFGHMSIVKILWDHVGANVHARGNMLNHALQAVKNSTWYTSREEETAAMVELLLEYGADDSAYYSCEEELEDDAEPEDTSTDGDESAPTSNSPRGSVERA